MQNKELNEISYLENMLKNKPNYHVYCGESDYASDAIDQENRYNEELEKKIKNRIKYLKSKQ
jgi:hypothetical protein